MKPDIDSIKSLLTAFEDAPGPATDASEIAKILGWDIDSPLFYFHMRLLQDRGLVEGAENPRMLGYVFDGGGEVLGWSPVPIRLTAAGHDFAASLRDRTVVSKIKSTLADSGLAIWISVATSLAVETAKQKLGITG